MLLSTVRDFHGARLAWGVLAALALGCSGGFGASVQPGPAADGDADADADSDSDTDGDSDGADCGYCPEPGECRDGMCLQPAEGGALCEFDDECEQNELCIAGRCTPDCRIDATCGCANNDSCQHGFVCQAGQCLPDGGEGSCIADDECPAGDACIDGVCLPPGECDVVHPNLDGTWEVKSELRLREALPGWLDGFLSAVSGPFRFLAGQSDDLGLDIPIIEDLIEDAVRDWAQDSIPQWALDLMVAIADLNDILSTMQVDHHWDLDVTALDEYRGEDTWDSIAFTFRGEDVEGRPEDILGWQVESDPFDARAVCGVFYVDRHDVDAAIGAIIAWLVDTVVYLSTDGEYENLAAALFEFEGWFCEGAASAADDLARQLDGPDVYGLVEAACDAMLAEQIDRALEAINEAMLEMTVLRLQGRADIVDRDDLDPGFWMGTLGGSDFTGDFVATRR